jgi:CDP-glucose 4,6-dehydratase
VNPSPAFWRGRRVLVTGHTGFKGAWLWLMLRGLGAEPHGFALPPDTDPNLFDLAGIGRTPEGAFGDIRDLAATRARLTAVAPEIVFHLAAQALVGRSHADPLGTFATNVTGTAHVLEAVRACPSVRAVVVVTSDKCYRDDGRGTAFREPDPLGGRDPYSASKAAAEIVAASWRASFLAPRVALATARAGNVIGGGDWAEGRLIPDCVRAFARGEAVVLRYPGARRPWQHVLEPLSGYLLLAEALLRDPDGFAEGWNFGPAPSDGDPVEAVVAAFAAAWGSTAGWARSGAAHPVETAALRIDPAKAEARLGWRARLQLPQALEWTAAWYRRVLTGEPASACCAEQIAAYLALGNP